MGWLPALRNGIPGKLESGVVGGKKSAKPDVVPELVFESGHWIFINFHYDGAGIPVNENLMSILQELKKSREKDGK